MKLFVVKKALAILAKGAKWAFKLASVICSGIAVNLLTSFFVMCISEVGNLPDSISKPMPEALFAYKHEVSFISDRNII